MPGLIKINLGREPGPFFDLRHLLALIPAEGKRLAWSVFPMGESTWMMGDLTPLHTSATELAVQVDESEAGVPLSWDQLVMLAQGIDQTVWGTFIGCRDKATFARLGALYEDDWMYLHRATPAYYEAVELAFQAVDSTFWLVYAQDDGILERLRAEFTEKVENLRAW